MKSSPRSITFNLGTFVFRFISGPLVRIISQSMNEKFHFRISCAKLYKNVSSTDFLSSLSFYCSVET